MAATLLRSVSMASFVDLLRQKFPELTFEPGDTFVWSPRTRSVRYRTTENATDTWSLLHETSHALLGHTDFRSDFELLSLEVAAWERAQKLAQELGQAPIDTEYIEDCLDTYRDWLHKRATCPSCGQASLQTSDRAYACLNCSATWQVTQNRHCRHYRARERATASKQKTSA